MLYKFFSREKRPYIYGLLLVSAVIFLFDRLSLHATTTPYPSNRCSQYVRDSRTYGVRYNRIWADSILSIPLVGDSVTADTCHQPQIFSLGPNSLWWYDGRRNYQIASGSGGGLTGADNGLTDSFSVVRLGGTLINTTDIEMPDDTMFSFNFNNFDDQQPFLLLSAGSSSMGYNYGAVQTVLIAAADIGFNGGPANPAVELSAPNATQTDSTTNMSILGDSVVICDLISNVSQTPYIAFNHTTIRHQGLANFDPTQFITADAFGNMELKSVNATHNIVVPSTGGTVTLTAGNTTIVNPGAGLAALSLHFPTTATNGQTIQVKFEQAVAALTLAGGSGTAIIPSAATVTGSPMQWAWDGTTSTWY
jgi:hypothetical protein